MTRTATAVCPTHERRGGCCRESDAASGADFLLLVRGKDVAPDVPPPGAVDDTAPVSAAEAGAEAPEGVTGGLYVARMLVRPLQRRSQWGVQVVVCVVQCTVLFAIKQSPPTSSPDPAGSDAVGAQQHDLQLQPVTEAGQESSGQPERPSGINAIAEAAADEIEVLEASAGTGRGARRRARQAPSVQDAAAEHLLDEAEAMEADPSASTPPPTKAPPSAKRKRTGSRQPPAAAAEAATVDGPAAPAPGGASATKPVALRLSDQQVDEGAAAELASLKAQPPVSAPPSAKGKRNRARQPPAKFQPSFAPDRPAPKGASATAASVKVEPSMAASASDAASRARRSRGTAAANAAQDTPEAEMPDGMAGVQDEPQFAAGTKQEPRNKKGSRAASAGPRQVLLLRNRTLTNPPCNNLTQTCFVFNGRAWKDAQMSSALV